MYLVTRTWLKENGNKLAFVVFYDDPKLLFSGMNMIANSVSKAILQLRTLT